jgi:hypothetical protein
VRTWSSTSPASMVARSSTLSSSSWAPVIWVLQPAVCRACAGHHQVLMCRPPPGAHAQATRCSCAGHQVLMRRPPGAHAGCSRAELPGMRVGGVGGGVGLACAGEGEGSRLCAVVGPSCNTASSSFAGGTCMSCVLTGR